jgi:hypothetical protein
VIGGLLLVMTGLGIGQWMIQLGNEYVATRTAVPETVVYGQRGVAKFPRCCVPAPRGPQFRAVFGEVIG